MADPAADILGRLECAAESMVFADPQDLQSLAAVHTALEGLQEWAADNHVLPVVTAAANLVEKMILGEIDDPAHALETVNNTIACLQHMAGHGIPAHEIDFPAELLPQPAETGQSPASAQQTSATSVAASVPCVEPESGAAVSDDKILAEFLARQEGVLTRCEELILTMEKDMREEDLDELRRIMHTIKGEAGLLGLPQVERLCHKLEDLTQNRLPEGATELLLRSKDWLAERFASLAGKGITPTPIDELLQSIERLAAENPADPAVTNQETGREHPPETAPPAPRPITDRESLDHTLLSEFLGEAGEHLENTDIQLLKLETDPDDDEAANAVFRAFHTIKGVAGFLGLEEIGALAHETENLLDRVRRNELRLTPGILDVIFDCVDALKKMRQGLEDFLTSGQIPQTQPGLPSLLERVQTVAAGMSDPIATSASTDNTEKNSATPESPGRKLGQLLVSAGAVDRQSIEAALETQRNTDPAPRLGEVLVKQEQVPAREVAKAIRTQQTDSRQPQARVRETLRVDADRLDRMVEMIGEMVIAESMVSRAIEQNNNRAEIMRNIGRLDKITRELQEIGMSLRMVPVRGVFQKMARLVRDLSRKSGKQVEFVMSGEDTELDKSVVDRIGDPLVHMVRNAVDHGIESDPAAREAAGKPATGRVELRAFHRGGNIYIELEDDGRGLDREAIIAKAIERGLISSADNMSDREVWDLIFAPGFSTAKKITDVSGRGVGMDVVKRNIEALRGQIEVRSEPGKGSVISLRLPLTLAIIEGMALRVGDDRYFIPTLNIIRSLRPKPDEISTINGRGEMLYVHGKLLPLFRLKDIFAIPRAEDDPTRAIAMIIEDNGNEFALLVDELLGQQQVVIKNLGAGLEQTPGISGGAIMSDGRVGLILDPGGLMSLAHDANREQEKAKTTASGENAEEYIGDDILAKVG